MTSTSMQKVYIADGFVDDCEELIQRCLQSETLNFGIFCRHWKEMNFAFVFHGRTSGAEIAEFSEEAIHIAKRYMVSNSSNYEESVAGLFLVYALLNLQPYSGFAPLRLTPQDLDGVYCLEDVARKNRRTDVLYILGKVLIEGPCHFHAGEREYGIDRSVRKYCTVPTSIDTLGCRPKGVFYRQNEELDLLRELSSLSRRYTRSKAVIYGSKRPVKTLNYIDEHLTNEMAASLKQLIVGNNGTKAHEVAVQSIKQKAMKDTVNKMRHLTTIEDRQQIEAEKPTEQPKKGRGKRRRKKNNTLTDSPPKDKSSAPVDTKLIIRTPKKKRVRKTSISNELVIDTSCGSNASNEQKQPKRRRTKQKIVRPKRRKDSSSTDSDDFSIASSGDSVMTEILVEEERDLPTLDDYIDTSNNEKTVKIDKVPVFIRAVDEKSMEIEIVGQEMKKKGRAKKQKVAEKTEKCPPKKYCPPKKAKVVTKLEKMLG